MKLLPQSDAMTVLTKSRYSLSFDETGWWSVMHNGIEVDCYRYASWALHRLRQLQSRECGK